MSYKKKYRIEEGCLFSDLMPFGGNLNEENRWIKLGRQLPWEELEKIYMCYFSEKGRPGKNSRCIIGILIVKHMMNFRDNDVVDYLHENPYVQYFCGNDNFVSKGLLESSTLTRMRKRLGVEFWKKFENEILSLLMKRNLIKTNVLMVDATVAPSNIKYPTDCGILEDGRKWLVKTIKKFKKAAGLKEKIRTYSRKARNVFLNFQKKKNKTRKQIRKAKKMMLQYVRRNIRQVEYILKNAKEFGIKIRREITERLEVIKEVVKQQTKMYVERTRRIKNRIVSICKPNIRPIMRGKSGKEVEFGPKISVGEIDGYGVLDKFSFESYHEGNELETSLKKHEQRFGEAPKEVLVDKIYGTRTNREIARKKNIRLSVEPLGRKSKSEVSKNERKWIKRKQRERNRIEGLIGTLKTKYGLDRLRYRIPDGEKIEIRLGLLAKNLNVMLARS